MLQLFEQMDSGMETALAVSVPLISGIAELIGLLIIVVSLLRTTYHYLRVVLFHDDYDYHLEMSTGLITALEFLMAAEVSKTILLPSLDAVLLLVATFGSRALMSILLRVEQGLSWIPRRTCAVFYLSAVLDMAYYWWAAL